MQRESIRSHRRTAALVLALFLACYPALATADDGQDSGPASAQSGRMEDHEAHSRSPEGMTVGSHDPDEMTVGSESMDGRIATPRDPETMVTDSEKMTAHEASSEDVTLLEAARPAPGFEAIEIPGQSEWQSTTDPAVLMARRNVLRAEKRARAARTTYGEMMERNYPRGEARIRIVNERDASMKAFEEAKSALAEADAGN